MKIGIAITTHDRPDLLARCLNHIDEFADNNAIVVVVDDGTSTPVNVPAWVNYVHRNDIAQGIATAKNQCIEILMDYGCDQLFLLDDDTWPVKQGWEQAYIDSPEPHLAHSWNLVKVWEDEQHTAYHASGGSVLYYDRRVIEDTGGMRTCFGKYGCEHVNLSDRIHNRGWTTWRYADLTNAHEYFYECDRYEKQTHSSTVSAEDLQHNLTEGTKLWLSMLEDKEYVPYSKPLNAVITTLFTSLADPQRHNPMQPSLELLKDLIQSVKYGRMVVLHDELVNPYTHTGNGYPVVFNKVQNQINPYFGRWLAIYQYLREHPEIDNVWCVDGTDVTQLRDPFDMEPGKLYLGSEQSTLRNEWVISHHPDTKIQSFFLTNLDLTLLNPGTVGGDRATVMEFAHAMSKYWFDNHIARIQKWQTKRAGVGDMAACQLIAYTQFSDRLVYGPSVNTLFKGDVADNYARWKHK